MDKKGNRSKAEIASVLHYVEEAWKKNPEMRFGQLVVNVLGTDPFYTDDSITQEAFARWANK